MKYQLIDHTADFRVHIFGKDLQNLFSNASEAMFHLITEPDNLNGTDIHDIHVTGDDWPDLMVNWLRELLYLWNGKELLVKKAEILSITEYELSAKVSFDIYDPDRHLIKEEIKAVTYHEIEVTPVESGWESKVIFDV